MLRNVINCNDGTMLENVIDLNDKTMLGNVIHHNVGVFGSNGVVTFCLSFCIIDFFNFIF
jgi:hypothetical protein